MNSDTLAHRQKAKEIRTLQHRNLHACVSTHLAPLSVCSTRP